MLRAFFKGSMRVLQENKGIGGAPSSPAGGA